MPRVSWYLLGNFLRTITVRTLRKVEHKFSTPGKVAAVEVQPGDTVSAGDTLVVVEAMKMEHPIRAPRDGVVAQVNAEVGVMVSPGAPLVVLEDES